MINFIETFDDALTTKDCDYIKLVDRIAKTSNNLFVDLEKKQPLNLKNEFNQGGNLFQSISNAINKLNLKNKLNLVKAGHCGGLT